MVASEVTIPVSNASHTFQQLLLSVIAINYAQHVPMASQTVRDSYTMIMDRMHMLLTMNHEGVQDSSVSILHILQQCCQRWQQQLPVGGVIGFP